MRIREIHNGNVKSIIESEIHAINEHPNQAIKFLKDRRLDPAVSPIGKDVLDKVIEITNADGFTGLFTKFHVTDKLPFDELKELHTYLKVNKQSLNQLPKPPIQYERYADLHRDIQMLEMRKQSGLLLKELPSHLKREVKSLEGAAEQDFYKLGEKFSKLKDGNKQQFIAKISKYKDIYDLMRNLRSFITGIESGEDAETIINKIKNTSGAEIVEVNQEKNYVVAFVSQFDASKTLGCTSSWCISSSTQQWRNYKKGGMRYFFIWDFNFDPSNANYMVATAFNPKDPESSRTHIKDDKQVKLQPILDEKGIPIEQFNKYLEALRAKYLESIKNGTGFLKALKSYVDESNEEDLIEHIRQSKAIQEHGDPENVHSRYNNQIETGINETEWLEIFDIDDSDYKYFQQTAGYSHYDAYDDDTYMHHYLGDENMAKIDDIAKKLGLSPELRKKLVDDEGDLKEFLEKYKMNKVIDTFNESYAEAQSEAEETTAKNAIATMPFDIEYDKIDASNILDFIQEHDMLDVISFDDFIEKSGEHIDEFNVDNFSEASYAVVDFDNLVFNIGQNLDTIIEELDDPDSEMSQEIKHMREGMKILKALEFKRHDSGDYYKTLKDGKLIIIKGFQEPFEYKEDSNEYKNGLKGIPDEPSFDAVLKDEDRAYEKRGSIRYSNLPNYVTNYEIPYKESVQHIKNIIHEEILGLV